MRPNELWTCPDTEPPGLDVSKRTTLSHLQSYLLPARFILNSYVKNIAFAPAILPAHSGVSWLASRFPQGTELHRIALLEGADA